MGPDISYYSKLKYLDCVFDSDGEPINSDTREPIENYTKIYKNSDFPGRCDEFHNGQAYSYSVKGDFAAGSYTGYNRWREDLARIAGYKPATCDYFRQLRHDAGCRVAGAGPFFELICFSDCEGTIGTAVSAKLAADFADHQNSADKEDEWFRSKYSAWRKAFETAADGGAVRFH